VKAFVSASAIGYYGFTDRTLTIDEDGERGFGFSADLCVAWEEAAERFRTEGLAEHVAILRVSLVLGLEGGIFPTYYEQLRAPPLRSLPSTEASFPWNHVADMAGIFAYAVEKQLDGIYNTVAPQPASLLDVWKSLANEMHDAGYVIEPFSGQHLVSNKLIGAGYQFKFPSVEGAIHDLITKTK
jgi:NAD dependent epimerase/dehydratase family enzyme